MKKNFEKLVTIAFVVQEALFGYALWLLFAADRPDLRQVLAISLSPSEVVQAGETTILINALLPYPTTIGLIGLSFITIVSSAIRVIIMGALVLMAILLVKLSQQIADLLKRFSIPGGTLYNFLFTKITIKLQDPQYRKEMSCAAECVFHNIFSLVSIHVALLLIGYAYKKIDTIPNIIVRPGSEGLLIVLISVLWMAAILVNTIYYGRIKAGVTV